ncbi:type II secretion system protein GspC [Agaribacter flavus]|uniref:Type II secretion system protein GspC n=1 Tax=Agaribacter flavus TaxID=1902781 RepID=A0ABV7FTC5_9ALTE
MNAQFLTPIQQFYQRHDTKLVFIIVLLLSVYLLMWAAKLTWALLPVDNASEIASQPAPTNNAPNIGSQPSKTNLQKLLSLNLFGDPSSIPKEEVQQVTEAPETKLNLVLSGVVASSNPEEGVAVIAYRNTQQTYGIGDKIEGTNVTLVEIFSDRVIIKNRLTRETLMMEGVDFDEANRQRSRQATNTDNQENANVGPQPAREVSRQEAEEIRQQVFQNPDSFADFIRLTPERNELGIIGYKVAPGKRPAFFNSVGLKNGDVLTELNGRDLSNPQQALEALSILREAEELDLVLLRGGEPISLSIEIPRDI